MGLKYYKLSLSAASYISKYEIALHSKSVILTQQFGVQECFEFQASSRARRRCSIHLESRMSIRCLLY